MANDNRTFYAKSVSESKSFSWKDIFSEVFKKHSKEQTDKVFSAGLTGQIPSDDHLLDGWQKPWVFSRVLIYGIIAWLAIYLVVMVYQQVSNASVEIGSMILVPTAVVPLSLTLFYWEMNIPRNIPFYTVLKLFIYGGVGTGVVFWMIVRPLIGNAFPDGAFMNCLFIGITEELTKLILVAFALRKADHCWGLNGFVVGSAVGCGFAVFETASYIFRSIVSAGTAIGGFSLLTTRGIMSINGHVAWAAMFGAALAMSKGKQKLQAKHFGSPTFLFAFAAAILLHTFFDYILYLEDDLAYSSDAWYNFLTQTGVLPDIVHTIIFAIPTYAIILWLLRKSVRQVVTYASGVGRNVHYDQVRPANNAVNYAGQGAYVPTQPVQAAQPVQSAGNAAVLTLECVSGELSGQKYTIAQGRTFTIGRGHQNNIQFSDGAKGISRSHCSVTFDGVNAIVVDLGSTHGTFFANGLRFQPEMRNPMKNGDTFYLASPKNTFRITIR